MIDHTRPQPHSDSDSEPAARLDDFQVFRRAGPYIYSPYYHNSYNPYLEPAVEDVGQHYHNLVNRDYYSNVDSKPVKEWNEDDSVAWIMQNIFALELTENDFPYYQFRMTGPQLHSLSKEDFRSKAAHPLMPHQAHAESSQTIIADIIFDKLHKRYNDEEYYRPTTVLRYVESDPYSQDMPQTIMDLDTYERNRQYVSDYTPNDSSILPAFASDDAEDPFLDSQRESPDYYGSDESNRSDEKDSKIQNKITKRPPGRPPGSGAKSKIHKRPRSVSVPEFLRDLLLNPETCPAYIRWEDFAQRKFRFVKPDWVAKLWGKQKNNENMTFEKFSRAMRYHYRQGVLEAVPSARLVYKFGPKFPPINGDKDNPNFEKKAIKTEYQPYEVCC